MQNVKRRKKSMKKLLVAVYVFLDIFQTLCISVGVWLLCPIKRRIASQLQFPRGAPGLSFFFLCPGVNVEKWQK